MDAQERIGRAEFLTRDLAAAQAGLQGRLDAAVVTQDALNRAINGIEVASLYGIDLSGYQTRIDANRGAYAIASTAAEFNRITADLNLVRAAADNAIYRALSSTHVMSCGTLIYHSHSLSREDAATSLPRTHHGIHRSQGQI